MKNRIRISFYILFFSLIAFKVSAFDGSIFAGSYPNFNDYQSQCLRELNNYFSTLFLKSIIKQDQKDGYQLKVLDNSGKIQESMYIRIERSRSETSLTESVYYNIASAQSFNYTLVRTGTNLVETPNMDLLVLNFNNIDQSYDLSINQLQARFQTERVGLKSYKSFIYLGFMEINLSIENIFEETQAVRNYIYFFKEMPNPQAMLSVRANR